MQLALRDGPVRQADVLELLTAPVTVELGEEHGDQPVVLVRRQRDGVRAEQHVGTDPQR